MRKFLLLSAVWGVGSAVVRLFDVIVEMASGAPLSLSDGLVLFVFDLAAAGFAYWLRANLRAAYEYPAVVSRLSGVLVVLLLCRVVLGVGLARPIQYAAQPDSDGTVYGNTLAHQLTSTFDVVLVLLAVAVLAVAVFVLGRQGNRGAGSAPPAPIPTAETPARRPVPKWQAPSQWAAPAPHEAAAAEPEPVELDPIDVKRVEPKPAE